MNPTNSQPEGTQTQDQTPTSENPLKAIADKLVVIAGQQLKTGIEYRQPKIDNIMKAEELYYNRVKKTLKGRFNIPLPIVSGFVDTLLSKIDDEITINYDHTEEADKIRAKKVTAAWRYDSSPTRGMWGIKDILVKKLAIFSGRGIYSIFSESDPSYKNHLEPVDAFDFVAEPGGGWHLEDHLFCGRENIFRTKNQIETGPQYDKTQVAKLIAHTNSEEYKNNQSKYLNHQTRMHNVGLDPQTNNYVGEPLFSFVEWNMTHDGKRYYLLFEPRSLTWIRCEELQDITGKPPENELPRYQFRSWATHTDYWNFWSKAPVDDVVPVAIAMKTLVNFMFDDFQKKLFGQRIYDAEIIQEPSQLEWDRPDKLISAVLPAGKRLSDAVYEFQTGDNSSVTINLLDYFRNFVALESGVTPGAKGEEDTPTLGVAKINLGEVADRLGLTNKQYVQCHAELGASYLSGMQMCMPIKLLIRMIGESGAESAEISEDDLKFSAEPDIRITGGKTESLKNEQKKIARSNSLTAAANLAPDLLNKKVAIESILQNGEWEADEISALMDVNADGDENESIKASQAIQDIIDGKQPELYQGATTRFQNKIYKFAIDKTTDSMLRIKLSRYALAHREIVIKNMARKAFLENMANPNPVPAPAPAPANSGSAIVPNGGGPANSGAPIINPQNNNPAPGGEVVQ